MKQYKFLLAVVATASAFTVFHAVPAAHAQSSGATVVRIDDPSGSHCIDADSEKITVAVRRVFTENKKSMFSGEGEAGIAVHAQVADAGAGAGAPGRSSDNRVSVVQDPNGRVSLPLEYSVASGFPLNQGGNVINSMGLDVTGSRPKSKKLFGKPDQGPEQIAHIDLKFNEGKEENLDKCKSAGYERTGAIAVLRYAGAAGANLIPVTNTQQQYCFRYSSDAAYELLAAKRNEDGTCPAANAFQGVRNDYVLLLLSSQRNNGGATTMGAVSAGK